MAHFAEIGADNIVTRVIVVPNEHEADGPNWCHNLLGGRWVQTSYNDKIRKHFAGAGYTYDSGRAAFLPEKPYPSWSLDEAACVWLPPVPYPSDAQRYVWDENAQTWQPVGGAT
jgi:hypothetical protein